MIEFIKIKSLSADFFDGKENSINIFFLTSDLTLEAVAMCCLLFTTISSY